MKRIICIITFGVLLLTLLLGVLAGCKIGGDDSDADSGAAEAAESADMTTPPATATPQPEIPPPDSEPFRFTEENFPRIDGSTATIPLIEAVTNVLLGKPRFDVNTSVSKTSGAYTALAYGEADILLVYDGGDETRAMVDADNIFETVPIGKDALVFLVNRDNPVGNLSTEQVQKIFTGEYTNWNEVGGNDEPIRAYQRGRGAGSQALMDKLVMDGLDMADPARVPVIDTMGGLVDAVASFTGGPAGIGYNVFFYVTEMRGNDYIKILSIDGVEPTYETIQSGEYPFVSEFYSVIRKSEPEGSPARVLHEWMLTIDAQNLMASENYVALYANPSVDSPVADGVFTLYPEGEEPVYFKGTDPFKLEARGDYGELYFYFGGRHRGDWFDSEFYGLCTGSGEIVTDPVYTVPLLLTDSKGNKAYFCYKMDAGDAGQRETTARPALLFSTDGSRVAEFDGAELFFGFTGVVEDIRNADILAVMKGGKWGAVNLMGETVVPFSNNDYHGIYPVSGMEMGGMLICLTADRFIDYGTDGNGHILLDGHANIIAAGLEGTPIGMHGGFIATFGWGESENIHTYTLDGERIAGLLLQTDGYTSASASGDYILVRSEKSSTLYDREFNAVCEYSHEYVAEDRYYYNPYHIGPNVVYGFDRHRPLYRTYLPDGTRLVTWYDSDSS